MTTISFRTDPDTKTRWQQLAKKLGRGSSSGLLKMVIDQVLKTNGVALQESGDTAIIEDSDTATEKVTARFKPHEFVQLTALAKEQSMKPGTWVASLIRAKLKSGQAMNREEIAALRESTRQLQAIGRNLNQIARLTNIEWREAERLKREHLVLLAADIKAHTEKVGAVLASSTNKWS
jgi:predicted transcriptional regulator